MALFRRENDQRRVAKFPNKATAEQTISLIAKSGALRDTGKFNRAESSRTRSEIKTIQKDAKQIAEDSPKNKNLWPSDAKPNFDNIREAQIYPSAESNSPTPRAGKDNYLPSKAFARDAEGQSLAKKDIWS